MGHGTKVSGSNKLVTAGFTKVSGVNKKITKGLTLVGGVQKDINFSAGEPVGNLAVGTSIFSNHNGNRTEFIIVNQGIPSNLYDASCDGTWLIRKDVFELRAWSTSSAQNLYNKASINEYLSNDYVNMFDSAAKSYVKQVKIPYYDGASDAVASGSKGLSCKSFLPSLCEVGLYSETYTPAAVIDGSLLPYFIDGYSAAAYEKRIALFNGAARDYWTRSAYTRYANQVWTVRSNGVYSSNLVTNQDGVRPITIIYSDTPINGDFDIVA